MNISKSCEMCIYFISTKDADDFDKLFIDVYYNYYCYHTNEPKRPSDRICYHFNDIKNLVKSKRG